MLFLCGFKAPEGYVHGYSIRKLKISAWIPRARPGTMACLCEVDDQSPGRVPALRRCCPRFPRIQFVIEIPFPCDRFRTILANTIQARLEPKAATQSPTCPADLTPLCPPFGYISRWAVSKTESNSMLRHLSL